MPTRPGIVAFFVDGSRHAICPDRGLHGVTSCATLLMLRGTRVLKLAARISRRCRIRGSRCREHVPATVMDVPAWQPGQLLNGRALCEHLLTMTHLPRITWYDYKGKKTPYQIFFEALDAMGEGVQGIFTTWLAKQTTCEYMLWNYIVDFYETGEVVQEDTEFSARGNEIHNLLAFGTTDSLMERFRDGKSYLQWRDLDALRTYQQQRLASTYNGRITEYALVGDIAGL
ncbi:MAG: hypothetical protein GYA24_02970, partial [Candidatus Lokiarchaeota archaeon]|nr:hypothetical protein [Candidatus Lokiarchaeota archaeon]